MLKAALVLMCALLAFAADLAAQCPTIKVIGPAGITAPGEVLVFSAELNVKGPRFEYAWSVDKGTIIGGQGTSKLTVGTDRSLEGQTITATVTVGGIPVGCENRAEESAGLDVVPACGLPMDEWSQLKPNDERGRLDLMFADLSNNPTHVALLVFKFKPDEDRLDSENSRIQFVLKHAKFRKFDKSRIWFGLEISEESTTRLYRMSPDTQLPCEGCLVFKGEHL